METKARIDRLSDEEFQRKYGVTRKTFEAMEEVLQEKYNKDHAKGGRKPKLSIRDFIIKAEAIARLRFYV